MNRLVIIFAIATLLVSAFVVIVPLGVESKSESQPESTPVIPRFVEGGELWNTIQNWRESGGLVRYEEDESLCNIANNRVVEVQSDYSHSGFNDGSEDSKTTLTHISENISENLGYATPGDTLQGWLDSPPHRKALESNYTHSCVRCQGLFCVQIFGRF